VVYEGTNPDTGQPIIKAFLNPLVSWIWAGVVLMVLGTFVALVPSLVPSGSQKVPVGPAGSAEQALHPTDKEKSLGTPALKGGD
jgi:cytochrome c-type biogenesis protein CcmF